MEFDDLKCAVVLDAELPIGVAANIAAIMGVSLGKRLLEIVGADVHDAKGGKQARRQSAALEIAEDDPKANRRR